jgi:hypothetical protein
MEAWQEAYSSGLRLCFGHHVDLDKGDLLMEAIWPCDTPHTLVILRKVLELETFCGSRWGPDLQKVP